MLRIAWAGGLLGALAFSARPAMAEDASLDPTRIHQFALAPAQISDESCPYHLPRTPSVGWRVRVAGTIQHSPVITSNGAILLSLSNPMLVEYDSTGRLSWTARLRASRAAIAPIVLADGARLVLTEAAEALAFSPRGQLMLESRLPLGFLDASTSVASTPDGRLLIASGRRLLGLDAAFNTVFLARFDQEIRGVFGGTRPLLVSATGTVFEITQEGRATPLGGFSNRVDAVIRLGLSRVVALLDAHYWNELELDTQTITRRAADPDLELSRAFAFNSVGEWITMGGTDLILAFGANGREKFRAALPPAPGGARPEPTMLLDRWGSALVARAGMDLVSVSPEGEVTRAEGTGCAEPLRPSGIAENSAVFACRSGILLSLTERVTTPSPALRPTGADR